VYHGAAVDEWSANAYLGSVPSDRRIEGDDSASRVRHFWRVDARSAYSGRSGTR